MVASEAQVNNMKFFDRFKRKKIEIDLTEEEKRFYDLIKSKDRTIVQLRQRGFESPKSIYRSLLKKGITDIKFGISEENNQESLFYMEERNEQQ